ncbi:MAG: ATP-binding protein [Capnocytophaga sp.]|nr:ATP-binding protein [Capnocytophaga sp.]
MLLSKRTTFKVIFSYLLLVLLSVIVGSIIYNEIQKLTFIEDKHETDRMNIIRFGNILALMYETESAGRTAVQSEDMEGLQNFVNKNSSLQDDIAQFKSNIHSPEHRQMLDSVQYLIQLKNENIKALKTLQDSDSSSSVIRTAIRQLTSVEPVDMSVFLKDIAIEPATEKRKNTEIRAILDKYKNVELPSLRSQKQIDSVIAQTKKILNSAEQNYSKQRLELIEKSKMLWENDLQISDKIRQILYAFESEIIHNSQLLSEERQILFEKSKTTLQIASIIAIFVIVIFSLLILNDFLKVQRFRQQLEVANRRSQRLLKSREQLISMVSHDVRTPLSTIVGYTELLRNQSQSEKEKNYVSHISSASHFITKLVDELLDYSKIEAGVITLEKVPFTITELVEEVANNVKASHADKPVSLAIEVDDYLRHKSFSSDSYRIKQVLYNLLSNAFKFTEKGNVRIRVESAVSDTSHHLIAISVTDSGIGIQKEKQEHVFEEFAQADEQISQKYGGSGLGLHISKKLAQLLKGDITLQSEYGVGSTFTFTFEADLLPAKSKTNTLWNSTKKANEITIAIIDDDETILQLIGELLQRVSIQFATFDNGKDVLASVQKRDFDMIITDIQLPGMNGFHFITLFNETYTERTIPVIAITGRKDVPENFYTESGFAGMLAKPFLPKQFYDKLHHYFPNLELNTIVTDENVSQKISADYRPEVLSQFMGDDTEGIRSVLELFMDDSVKNIQILQTASLQNDLPTIRHTAHRMLSMFGQINAVRETEILHSLDRMDTEDNSIIRQKINELNRLFTDECRPLVMHYCQSLS